MNNLPCKVCGKMPCEHYNECPPYKPPKTPAERVAASRKRKRSRSISIEGEVLDRLASYQQEKGWSSRSEALRALLEKAGY